MKTIKKPDLSVEKVYRSRWMPPAEVDEIVDFEVELPETKVRRSVKKSAEEKLKDLELLFRATAPVLAPAVAESFKLLAEEARYYQEKEPARSLDGDAS